MKRFHFVVTLFAHSPTYGPDDMSDGPPEATAEDAHHQFQHL